MMKLVSNFMQLMWLFGNFFGIIIIIFSLGLMSNVNGPKLIGFDWFILGIFLGLNRVSKVVPST
jgi:hypothetical protein